MRQKKKRHFQQPLEESAINLTPLIDVVFVILVAFILIAPLLEIDNIQLAKGAPKEKSTPSKCSIQIFVNHLDEVFINHRRTNLKELPKLLHEQKKKFPKQIPQIFLDKKATFGTYQSLKTVCEKIPFSEMHIVLQSGENS